MKLLKTIGKKPVHSSELSDDNSNEVAELNNAKSLNMKDEIIHEIKNIPGKDSGPPLDASSEPLNMVLYDRSQTTNSQFHHQTNLSNSSEIHVDRSRKNEDERSKLRASVSAIDMPISVPNQDSPRPTPTLNMVRLCIRLFDGSQLRHTFASSATLEDVRKFVDEHQTDGELGPYHFMQIYPQQSFSAHEELTTTLHDLGLEPSGTLVIKAITGNISHAYEEHRSMGYISAGFNTLLSGVKNLGSSIGSLTPWSSSTSSSQHSSITNASSTTSQRPRKTDNHRIHTLNELKKKDDFLPTYNGNSLNQL